MKSELEIPTPAKYTMSTLFDGNYFKIPMYQRNYAWTENQIEDFLGDLQDIVEDERSNHFFGQLVTFTAEDSRQEIIDGQQRLTSSLIFYSVLKDVAQDISEKITQSLIDNPNQRKTFSKLDRIQEEVEEYLYLDGDRTLILQQNSDNEINLNDFFKKLTDNILEAKKYYKQYSTSAPVDRMLKAYDIMKKWVVSYIKNKKDFNSIINCLESIYKAFSKHFYVVVISTTTRKEAFTIFETLNSRGIDLGASDIIKNHLMSILSGQGGDENLEPVNESWNRVSEMLENNSNKLNKYIRTYWSASHKLVSEAKLYRAISKEVENRQEAETFLKELESEIQLYTVLLSPTNPKVNSEYFNNKLLNEKINILSKLNVVLYYPIMLAMQHSNFSEEDQLKVVQKIISVFIRHRTISNEGTNKLETGFASIAKGIWDLNLLDAVQVNKKLDQQLLKNDKDTETNFRAVKKEAKQGTKRWTITYLIAELYSELYGDFNDDKLYQEVFDDDQFKPAHIVEKSISEPDYFGNWTIIENTIHLEKAKTREELAKMLNQSQLRANRLLADIVKKGWSDDDVDERQAKFAKKAIVIW